MKKISNENITHIYHLGDIHFRNLQRHSEYKLVFNKFLKKVKDDNLQNSVIYLAGDIAHAKTEMSPELIQEISWLFTECAKLRDTFIITGNHDCNLNNSYRLDVLTPIIDNLNNPKLHYLKDTGVYPFKNLTFVVYSILDHKDNWPSGYDIKGNTKICLFHGPVLKAKTDIGYTVASNSFTVNMFDGYHLTLLGDIHRRQTLQEYSEDFMTISDSDLQMYLDQGWMIHKKENNGKTIIKKLKPAVAYVGSTLQQNHGELLEGHGYLLWDIENRTYESYDIYNNYGFLTIDIINSVIPQWVYDEINTKLPKHPRLRLRFTNTPPINVNKCILDIKKLFKTSEITVTRTDSIGQLKNNSKLNKNIVGNVTDETFQNQLIRSYLENHFALENDDLDKITDINKRINTSIDIDTMANNIIWIPKTFEFSNMFSYGENNKVKFSNASGIIGVFAPNAGGKSSLFSSLMFCIFDKTDRSSISKHILNNCKDNFYCKFNFEIDGVDYFIERKARWTRNKTNFKVDVNFWRESDGNIVSLNGEQRRETNKNIEKFLGKFDDFILTTLSLQGNNSLFIDKSQSERKETLSQFIGIDIFDKLYKIAADENKDNATLIRKFKSNDFTSKLLDLTNNYNSYKSQYTLKNIELSTVNNNIETTNGTLMELNGKIVKLNSDLVGIDELLKRKKILKAKQSEIILKQASAQERVDKLELLQIELDEILDTFDEEKLKSDMNILNDIRSRVARIKNKLYKASVNSRALEDKLLHLDLHKYNPNCKICVANSKSIINTKQDATAKLKILKEQTNVLNKSKDLLISKINTLKKVESEWRDFNSAQVQENTVSRELNSIIGNISSYETDELKVSQQIIQQEKLILEYYTNEDQIKQNKLIRDEIDSIKTKLTNLKHRQKILTSDLLTLNGKASSTKTQRDTIQIQIDDVKNLEEQSKLFDYYLNAVSRDGISYELIEKALPMIEGEVNNILSQIVDFGMQLEIDGKNINAHLVYGNNKWSLEMCSGMERFISGLAIRVALINVCNLPRPNFLVIDEGLGTLDASNFSQIGLLFQYLKTQFDFIMLISHIESARDIVDNFIEIKKEDGFSSVKF